MTDDVTSSAEIRLKALLQEMAEAEARKEAPPARDDLTKKWVGQRIHFLRPLLAFGDSFLRGHELVLTEHHIVGSVDRRGASILDNVPNEAIGVGEYPADALPWIDDRDPVREALRRDAVDDLKARGITDQREWRKVHEHFMSSTQKAQLKRERDREEARRTEKLNRWTA